MLSSVEVQGVKQGKVLLLSVQVAELYKVRTDASMVMVTCYYDSCSGFPVLWILHERFTYFYVLIHGIT